MDTWSEREREEHPLRELWELFWTFAKMSAITFGGGAAREARPEALPEQEQAQMVQVLRA